MAKIEKMKSGNYRIRVFAGKDEDGKKHWKSFTHEDKKILKRIAAEYEDSHRTYVKYRKFKDCLESHIRAKEAILSPSTIRSYNSMANTLKDRYADFCALTIDRIDADTLQRLVTDLQAEGLSPKTVRNIHALISAVIEQNNLTVPKVILPTKTKPHVYEPTTDDVQATVQAARGKRIEIPILLAIHGLRRGEICALRYPDDFDGDIVHVQRAKVYIGNNQNIDKAPKTYESDRYVPLDTELVEKIKKQGYVTDYTLGALSEEFPDFLKRNGIRKYRFHDLRHFFVAYFHSLGYSDAEIMYIGGWRTPAVMVNSYRYVLDKNNLKDRMQKDLKKFLYKNCSENS